MDVRAAVAFEAGKPLEIETVQLEGPKSGEVLVEIKATGICHTDAFTLSGEDPEGAFPAILGHEGAGIVVETGPDVQSLSVGASTTASTSNAFAISGVAGRFLPWYCMADPREMTRSWLMVARAVVSSSVIPSAK